MPIQDPSDKLSSLFGPLKLEPTSAKVEQDAEELRKYVEARRNFQDYADNDLVKEIFILLEKVVKISQTYHPSHPIYQKFIDLLRWSFEACHSRIDPITLRVGHFELIFKDQVIYSNSSQASSVAFKLFKDGITSLSFHKGITQEEILKFVDILATNFKTENENDDLITLLWERDFEHIAYQAVDRFIELELADNEEYKAFVEKLNKEVATYADLRSSEVEDAAAEPNDLTLLEQGFSLETLLELEKETLIPVFPTEGEELKKIKEEIDAESVQDLVYKMMTLLFEVLYVRKSLSEYKEILNVLEKILESLVVNGNFFSATEVLKNLRRTGQLAEGLSADHLKLVADVIDRIGGLNGVKRIEVGLKHVEPDRLGLVLDFLALLNPNSIPFLCDLLGRVNNPNVQKILYQAILIQGRKDIPTLLTALEGGVLPITPETLSSIIKGEIGDAWMRLKEMASHKNPRVREGLAGALGKIARAESGFLLLKLLEDPLLEVRKRALTSLSSFRDDKIAVGLLKIIVRKDFNDKTFAEKKEFFKLLGTLGSSQTIPILRKILLGEKRWLDAGKYDELRACAALALGMLGTREAREALVEGTKSKRKMVKAFCEEALKALGGKID